MTLLLCGGLALLPPAILLAGLLMNWRPLRKPAWPEAVLIAATLACAALIGQGLGWLAAR